MSDLPKKAVYDDNVHIGEASTWGEVEALLVARGMTTQQARAARMLRGVPGFQRFDIISVVDLEAFMARTRELIAQREADRRAAEGA